MLLYPNSSHPFGLMLSYPYSTIPCQRCPVLPPVVVGSNRVFWLVVCLIIFISCSLVSPIQLCTPLQCHRHLATSGWVSWHPTSAINSHHHQYCRVNLSTVGLVLLVDAAWFGTRAFLGHLQDGEFLIVKSTNRCALKYHERYRHQYYLISSCIYLLDPCYMTSSCSYLIEPTLHDLQLHLPL